MIVFPLIRLV